MWADITGDYVPHQWHLANRGLPGIDSHVTPVCGGGGGTKKKPAEARASATDAEAQVMKMADGGFRPAFTVGFASDVRSGMIAAVAVDNRGSDMGKLARSCMRSLTT